MELLIPISIPSYRSVLFSSPLDNSWLNSLEVRHLVKSPAPFSDSIFSDCRQESYLLILLFERWNWESVLRLGERKNQVDHHLVKLLSLSLIMEIEFHSPAHLVKLLSLSLIMEIEFHSPAPRLKASLYDIPALPTTTSKPFSEGFLSHPYRRFFLSNTGNQLRSIPASLSAARRSTALPSSNSAFSYVPYELHVYAYLAY
ncbi:hypothetical protein ACSQ67_005589 [Phaseolus vulgaris]